MSMDASAAIAAALRALQAQAKESSEHLDAIDPLLGECKAAILAGLNMPSLSRMASRYSIASTHESADERSFPAMSVRSTPAMVFS